MRKEPFDGTLWISILQVFAWFGQAEDQREDKGRQR